MSTYNYEKWDEMIEKSRIDLGYHGLSISVLKDDTCIYRKGFGNRNFEKKLPMEVNTLFGIGSLTKSFTALAIMKLVESGKISLEDPVNKYIDFRLGLEGQPIKIKHLLSHSSGIPELNLSIGAIFQKIGIQIDKGIPHKVQDTLMDINNAQSEILFPPDTTFMYNNDMYMIIGCVIEAVSGMSYEEYVQNEILIPLEMENTKFALEINRDEENLIMGYHYSEDGTNLIPKSPTLGRNSHACGGLFSSVLDMEKYMRMYMNTISGKNQTVISQKSILKMWNPYIPKFIDDLENSWYGLGWFMIQNFLGKRVIFHGGDILTSGGLCIFVPDERIGIIIGVNGPGKPAVLDIAKSIIADILGKDLKKVFPQLQEKAKLRKLLGQYQSYRGIFKVEVTVLSGVILLKTSYPGLREPIYYPLAVENLDNLQFFVPTALTGPKDRAQFFIDPNSGKIWLRFNEYRFNKL